MTQLWNWRLTICPGIQVDMITYSDIHNTEETLIPLFEFLLVEYLHGQNAIFGNFPV